ncbi:MAG: hypothetical protein LBB41_07175 [Prevotellaceae bacterium]|jgi:hypothetical protein|nr:hypothetical protein [Prevotellaceae bacterium]
MTTYSSNPKPINKSNTEVFAAFSDLTKLETLREKIAESGQVQDFSVSTDEISFSVNVAGKVTLRIVECVPNEKIRFTLESALKNAEVQLNIKETTLTTSEITLTLTVEMPMMLKMMLDDKLNDGMDKMAEVIAKGINNDF